MQGRRVRLSDVAVQAGVSSTTASYILNGHAARMRIAPATNERVLAAASQLEYRPNRSARSLRTRRTATIGLVSDQVAGDQYGSDMLTGATRAAHQLSHLVVIGETGGDPRLENLLVEELLARQVDGVIYATGTARTMRLPRSLRGVRTVLLNCETDDPSTPAVVPDDRAGGREAAAALLDAGLDDVWVVGEDPTPEATAGPRRLAGLADELESRGSSVRGVVSCPWSVPAGFVATRDWLSDGGRADALVCLNDRLAMGVFQALAEAGLRVPDDVAVISFDGSPLATWLRPSLTSVRLPFSELGDLAVRRLLDPADPGGTSRVPMTVVHGDSLPAPRRL